MKIQPDDPRLTAFALGELEGEEHAEIAASVASDPALQALIDDIHGTVGQLSAALAAEPVPDVAPFEITVPRPVTIRRPAGAPVRARLFQFPYIAIGTLAAACFAIIFILLNERQETARQQLASNATDRTPPDPRVIELSLNETDAEVVSSDRPPIDSVVKTASATASEPPATPAPDAPAPPTTPSLAPAGPEAHVPTTIIAAAPTTLPETPPPASVTIRQAEATTTRAAGGFAHIDRTTSGPNARNSAPASEAIFREPMLAESRGLTGNATAPTQDGPITVETNGETSTDLLADAGAVVPPSARLRTTFSDFGASRYARNRASSAGSTTITANPESSGDAPPPATSIAYGNSPRAPEENIKLTAPPEPKVPYAAPLITGIAALDESAKRGRLDRGGQMADLETQLRDLRMADSPVTDFVRDNGFVASTTNPISVVPMMVDGASPTKVRRALLAGLRPSRDLVRIEELLNAHEFDYAAPAKDDAAPFAAALEVASAPWQPAHRLVRVGLQARAVPAAMRPAAHLVFLVQTSTAVATGPGRLALMQDALRQLVDQLGPEDQVAIVSASSTANLLLPSTRVSDRAALDAVITALAAAAPSRNSTALQLAYDVAAAHFVQGGINRVILAADGDAQFGGASNDLIHRLVTRQAEAGITLTALGFGGVDGPTSQLAQLARSGGGEIALVETPHDVRRAVRSRAGAGFAAVARHVKMQVEFNPDRVASWRLIGFEDRVFLREDFDSESLAADEINAGHNVTALFEVVPAPGPDDATTAPVIDGEILSVTVRYTAIDETSPRLLHFPLVETGAGFETASADFKFATAVAGFGMILRESPYKGAATLTDVATWARAGRGPDATGDRAAFIDLITRAQTVMR